MYRGADSRINRHETIERDDTGSFYKGECGKDPPGRRRLDPIKQGFTNADILKHDRSLMSRDCAAVYNAKVVLW